MTKLETEIMKLKTKAGNAATKAYEAERAGRQFRTEERVYRECCQAIEDAITGE